MITVVHILGAMG